MSKRFAAVSALVALTAALLCSCTATPEAVRPTHNPRADYARLMTTCLADYGFEANEQGTGLVVESVPSQREAVAEAVAECEHSLGYDTVSSLSEDQLGELYELEQETAACLTDLGYQVNLPSKQVFVDRYYSDEFPLLESQVSEQATESEYEAAMTACPPATGTYDPYGP